MIATLLAEEIVILFVMMACGILIVRLGLLKSSDSKVLSILCVYLILPCTFLKAFLISYSPEIASGFLLAVIVSLTIHCILFAIVALISKPLRLTGLEKASLIYSNAGNLIIPLVTNVLGPQWVIYSSAFVLVQLFFLWTHGLCLVRETRGFAWKEIFTNCNLIAACAGLVVFLTHLTLPVLVTRVLGNMSAAVGPISMLMIGMVLGGMNWKEALSCRRIYLMVALKMAALPFVVVSAIKYSPLGTLHPEGSTILLISLLASISPTATTVSQMAQLYGADSKYASTINMMTTLAALATMPLMVLYYLS